MRPIAGTVVPDGMLAVATAAGPLSSGSLFVADFRDMHALSFRGHLLGVDAEGSVRFGRRPLSMIDGIWYMREDEAAQRGNEDLPASASDIALELIE